MKAKVFAILQPVRNGNIIVLQLKRQLLCLAPDPICPVCGDL